MQINYKDAVTGQRWVGDEISSDNEYICVSKREGYYYIINVILGKPFVKLKFVDKKTALEFGKLLHKWYGEYFWIWDDPDWRMRDLIQLTQYTIPNGARINEIIKGTAPDEVLSDLKRFEFAQGE